MHTEPWRALLAAAGLALAGAAGCAGPSAESDVAHIGRLSSVRLPPSAASEAVDEETPDDARALLRRPLTADAAVRIALLNNRELRAALREVGIARGDLVQAGVLPNPELEISVMPRQGTLEHTHLEFSVEYNLTSALLAPMRKSAARAEHEAARYRSAGAVVELGYQVRAAFYAVQASQQRLAITHRALDGLAAARDAARALLEAGNVAELDAATQEAAYEEARVTAAQIELELLERRERLQRLLGLSGPDTAWRIDAELPAAPEQVTVPPRAETRALSASLELAELRSRLEAAARRAGLARTEGWLPDVAIGVHGERELAAPGEDHEHDGWHIGGALHFTLPLFNRKQGVVAARTAEFDSLLERYHARAIDVRSALRDARNRLSSAHARARHYQRVVVPARKRVLDQALLQYNAMQIGVFQLITARQGQLDAELALVETLREYWTAKAALDAILAGRRVEASGAAAPAGVPAAGHAASGTDGGGH